MRLSISNIAWDPVEDEQVAELLSRYSVDAIDIAPGKYFPEPGNATPEDMQRVKSWWTDRGIEIVGMQALLFGTDGLNVFGSPDVQKRLLSHLNDVCRVASGVGATYLVFGSPGNRDRSGLSDHEANSQAISFFRRVGDVAQSHGVLFCLEPTPISYGANFMITTDQTAEVVDKVDHSAIMLQLDTGALALNEEDPGDVVRSYASMIGHVHASEPDLLPLGDGKADHDRTSDILRKLLPEKLVTIEMLATKNESHSKSIERALQCAASHYCGDTDIG